MSLDTFLDTLIARLSENAETIKAFTTESSSGADPINKTLSNAPPKIQQAREDLLQTTHKLQQLFTGPSEFLERHQINYQSLSCLRWLLDLNILAHIPTNIDPISFIDVATSANVPLVRLKSVARMAMTGGFLCEPKPEHVAHSAISLAFVEQSAFQDWGRFMTHFAAPVSQSYAEATKRWGGTLKNNETAFNIAYRTEIPFFEYLKHSRELTELFAKYMRGLGESEGLDPRHVLGGFDWAGLGEAHVVDVGGSTGQVSALIAAQHPSLRFTVQDLPDTILGGHTALSTLSPEISSRITLAAHDFFTPQPLSADVYFLRKIMHDWTLDRARDILQHLVDVMRTRPDSSRLVIMDTILPRPGEVPPVQEAILRVRDLTMAQAFNNKEREIDEWEELFESTQPKLRLKNLTQPFGSEMAILEVVVRRDEADDTPKSQYDQV